MVQLCDGNGFISDRVRQGYVLTRKGRRKLNDHLARLKVYKFSDALNKVG